MEEQEESSSLPFELKDIQYALMRSWVLIAILGAGGMAGGIYSAATKSNYYTSKAKLLLRMGAREQNLTEQAVGGAGGAGRQFFSGMEDEIHMLSGQTLYTKLAEELGPATVLAPADPARYISDKVPWHKRLFHELQAALVNPQGGGDGKPVDASLTKATELLMRKTSLRAERFSNVISVYHTSSSPEKAQFLCEELIDAFIERHREQYSATPFVQDSKEKVDEIEAELKEAEADYFGHINECKNVSIDTELDNFQRDMILLDRELERKNTQRDSIGAQVTELQRQFDNTPLTVEVETLEVTRPNLDYDSKRDLLARWLVEKENVEFLSITAPLKAERRARYDELIQQVQLELAELEPVVVVQEAGTKEVPNLARAEIKTRIDALQVELAGLVVEIEDATERLAEMEKEKSGMLDCKQSHRTFMSKMTSLERDFERHSTRYDQLASLADLDEEEDKTNLRVLEPPDLPLDKAGPARGKIVVLGLMGGLAAGAALALLRYLLDPRLRHPHTIERVLKVPLIAVVPERRAVRVLRKVAATKPAPAG